MCFVATILDIVDVQNAFERSKNDKAVVVDLGEDWWLGDRVVLFHKGTDFRDRTPRFSYQTWT